MRGRSVNSQRVRYMSTDDASICLLLEDRNDQFTLQSLLEASGRSVSVADQFEGILRILRDRPGLLIASASALPGGALARLNQIDPPPAVLLIAGDDQPLFREPETLDTLAGSVSSSVAILHRPLRRSTAETMVRLVADLLDRQRAASDSPSEEDATESTPDPASDRPDRSDPVADDPSLRPSAAEASPGTGWPRERSKAESADEGEWSRVLEDVGMGVVRRASVAAPIRLSARAQELTGLSDEMWTANRLLRLVDRRDRRDLVAALRSAFPASRTSDASMSPGPRRTKAGTVDRTVRIGASGSKRWIRVRVGTAADPYGGTLRSASGWRALVEDVTTQQDRLQERSRKIEDLQTSVAESGRRVRRLAERLADAEETERERIASVLHDDLQPLIYGAQVQIETLQEGIEEGTVVLELPGDATAPAEQLGDLKTQLQQAVSLTRSLISNIRPPVLHNSAFADTLEWLRVHVEETLGADLAADVPKSLEIRGRGRRAFLFEAIREAVFNAVRHGNADRVVVRAGRVDDRVVVAVEDEGDGFDPDTLNGGESGDLRLGIRSIRQRCEDLGGTFRINSAPGVGTRVTLALPHEPAQNTDGTGEDVPSSRSADDEAHQPTR